MTRGKTDTGIESTEFQSGTANTDSVCKAPWKSFVAGGDDGEIEVEVTGNKISGTHKRLNKPIDGTCTPGRPHRITFTVNEDNGCTHTYDGVIGLVPATTTFPIQLAVVVGIVTRTGCPSVSDGDDEWVGTHTT